MLMDDGLISKWTERCNEWFFLEILVYISYIASMVILVVKSRLFNIG